MSSINYDLNNDNFENEYNIYKLGMDKIQDLYDLISIKINERFTKLNSSHKNLLKKYLLNACVICAFYFQMKNPIEQFEMNNGQDIFSIVNMILPYFELNKCDQIESLDELFINKGNKAKEKFESTYFIDHEYLKTDPSYLEKYFEANLKSINRTFSKVSSKLLPNWLNIFPYTISNYKSSNLYKNFVYLKYYSLFTLDDYLIYDKTSIQNQFIYNNQIDTNCFLLGYESLYGCMYNFLFSDIKNIKWMIFDKIYKNKVYPNIVILGELLQIRNISNTKWDQLDTNKKSKINDNWKSLIKYDSNLDLVKSLIIFYLRYEIDLNNLSSLKLDSNCLGLLRNKMLLTSFDNEELDETSIYSNEDELNRCIKKISSQIKIENIYNYIYACVQRFRYTWYGYKCLDQDSNILTREDYIFNCIGTDDAINTVPSSIKSYLDLVYITPKNIYNFIKSLLHKNFGSEYKLISNSPSWDSLDIELKQLFIDRLNFTSETKRNEAEKISIQETKTWFDIRGNLRRIYKNKTAVNQIYDKIVEKIVFSNLISDVIFETLVINGMLSYFKYNPEATNSKLIPDKNKNKPAWEKYIKSKIDITPYADSYNFLSNKKLSSHSDYFESVKKSLWYTNFGGNWVAQLQMFHHVINQRLLLITGATGAGKSTVGPFIILYGLKIINFDNNVKIMCTQPRKKPTKDNATRIAESLGVRIFDSLDESTIKNINYIQFKHSDQSVVDDEYHPCLRMITDGTLINMLKESYTLKKSNALKDNDYIRTNLFNAVLVDEAHEHGANMDIILTVMKFATYINNQLTLGIISATMDEDEPRYRKYYQIIDDNWKWPLNLNYLPEQNYQIKNYDSNLLDRRINLSPPFASTNFRIDEEVIKYKGSKEDEILRLVKDIIEKYPSGDILIFQNGQSEIIKLVEKLNNETPINVLAVPFYSELNKNILENVISQIANKEVRKKINIKKNININYLYNLSQDEKVDEGTYTRFIIVATNIAEASITIDTLKFVIDNGTQKNSIYDPNRDTTSLKVDLIANPNRKQRRGRVGRVAPGYVYYLYDINKLREEVLFKICIQNITTTVLDMLSTVDTHLITQENDPYLTDSFTKIPEFLINQYIWIDSSGNSILYSNRTRQNTEKVELPIYPYTDGKYDSETIIDPNGKFYLIHPNEDNFVRNSQLEIIKRTDYLNKPQRIIEYNKTKNIIDSNNKKTPYGELISNLEDLLETSDIKNIGLILDALALKISLDSEVFQNILLYIIIKNGNYSFGKSKISGKSDLILKINMIPKEFLNKIDVVLHIIEELNSDLENLDSLIDLQIEKNDFKKIIGAQNKKNVQTIIDIIKKYYSLKIKIILVMMIQSILNKLREENLIGRQIDYEKKFKIVSSFDRLSMKLYDIIEKNETIIKINVNSNIQFSSEIKKEFSALTDYEKIFVLIAKNFPYNLLQKVPESNFYIEILNRDVNRIYRVKSFSPNYAPTKIIKETNVGTEYLNNIIYYINSDDTYAVSNLSMINTTILNLVKKMIPYKSMEFRNKKINKEEGYKIYGELYKRILEKIDKIIELI